MQALKPGELQILLAMGNTQVTAGLKDVLLRQRVGRVFAPENNREAVTEMQDRAFNFIIIDEGFPDLGGIDFCRFLRLTNTPMAVAPIMFGIHAPDRAKVLAARDVGATKIVALPFTGASVIKAIQDTLMDMRPIVQTSSFNGPDRRTRQDPAFRGADRRNQDPKLIPADIQKKILKSIL